MSNVCSLTKTYKCHAVKLCTTGNGAREEGDNDGPSDSEEYCDFYIGADGPNENTYPSMLPYNVPIEHAGWQLHDQMQHSVAEVKLAFCKQEWFER